MENNPSLKSLEGRSLSAVCFVMDYVEFHFEEAILRALTNPILNLQGRRFVFPEPHSRDSLCALIGSEVDRVDELQEMAIVIYFKTAAVLKIPLDDNSRIGPEAAHFVPDIDKPILVW